LESRERLPLARKAALAREILGEYGRVRRSLRQNELPDVLVQLREGVRPPAGAERLVAGYRLAAIVDRVLGRLPTDARCLTRSLVLVRVLARRGIGSTLVIGVTPAPSFAAHAWVELAGRALMPADEATYSRLVEL